MSIFTYKNAFGTAAINIKAITSVYAHSDVYIHFTIPGCASYNQIQFTNKEERDQVLEQIIRLMQEA